MSTEDEIKVLSKSFNVCPTPSNKDNMKLEDDLSIFAKTLRIKDYFGDKPNDTEEDSDSFDSEEEIRICAFKEEFNDSKI